ncbi:MAG TPA: YihY/virulence factor BrkB family protein [Sporichthya sp.]|nr:YihY/virulence factor BrkB family protein [Sporichthya sp.]
MDFKSRLARLDTAQKERPALAIPVATVKKFGEDKSSNLAAMMAFWAFFSIFPLMLAAVTVLGYTLPEADKKRVLDQISSYMPLMDVPEGGLDGSVLALVVGLLAALWSGMAVVRITQDAFNSVWEVPQVERPKLLEAVKRSLLALCTIGVGLVASTFLLGFVSGSDPTINLGPLGRLLGFAAAIVLDIGLFVLAFRMLTDRAITTKDVLPGAVFAGVCFWLLSTLSSVIITRHLSGASSTYGTFATVITILWWFYLQSQLTLLGAQVNVVLKRHYYPRALIDAPETEADHRLLEDFVRTRQMVEGQEIATEVGGVAVLDSEAVPEDRAGADREDSDGGRPTQSSKSR